MNSRFLALPPKHRFEQIGKQDDADAFAVRRENMDTIEAGAGPSGTCPDIAVCIGAYAVGTSGFAVVFHHRESTMDVSVFFCPA